MYVHIHEKKKEKTENRTFLLCFSTFVIRIPKRWLSASHFFQISHERKSPGIRCESVARRDRPPVPTVMSKKENSKMGSYGSLFSPRISVFLSLRGQGKFLIKSEVIVIGGVTIRKKLIPLMKSKSPLFLTTR